MTSEAQTGTIDSFYHPFLQGSLQRTLGKVGILQPLRDHQVPPSNDRSRVLPSMTGQSQYVPRREDDSTIDVFRD